MIKNYYIRFLLAVVLCCGASVYDSYLIPSYGAWYYLDLLMCFVYGYIAGCWVILPMRRYLENVQYKK